MNKRFWKIVTTAGFFVAILAIATVLVLRLQVFERFGFYSERIVSSGSQRQISVDTQEKTQETELKDFDVDKRNLERFSQGCMSGNDCIPSIDQPKFVSAKQASRFLKDDDLVIGVAFEGWETEDDPVKAYPVKIMNWHEIVNDFVNENSVAVTYCPLCMTPRVYGRLFDGKAVDFGVSGMLLNSNLVMYDRETKSLWSQFDGQALVGPRKGQKLTVFPSVITRWKDWLAKHPATVVLSTDTGYDRPYDENPYGDYADVDDVYFPLEHNDNRREPKEVIFGIVIDGQAKAYPELELKKALSGKSVFTDEFAGKKLALVYGDEGLTLTDEETLEKIPVAFSYYFTWSAFYPDTQIFQAPESE